MNARLFTVAEVNALIPRLSELMRQAMELHRRASALQEALSEERDRIRASGGAMVDQHDWKAKAERLDGFTIESELVLCSAPNISLIARFDGLGRNGDLPPPGSSLPTGEYHVERFTWGFNFTLPGGSLLMIDHEHWSLPAALDDVDVIGVRWVATF